MLQLHIKTYHTSKLLTLLTQHVKNVHEKICGLQCTPLKIVQEETENAQLISTLTSNTLDHGLFIHQVIKM